MYNVKKLLVLFLLLIVSSSVLAQDAPTVLRVGGTEASEAAAAVAPVVWVNPGEASLSRIIGTDDELGLVVYNLQGEITQLVETEPLTAIDLRYGVTFGDDEIDLFAAGLDEEAGVLLFTIDDDSLQVEPIGSIEIGIDHAASCLYRSGLTDTLYLFVISEDGELEQYSLDGSGDTFAATLERKIEVGGEVEACTADDFHQALYISEGNVGLWRYGAEPETGRDRVLVDFSQVGNAEALGNFTEDIEALTTLELGDGAGYILVSNEAESQVNIYTRDENDYLGTFAIQGTVEPNGMDAIATGLGGEYADGILVTSNDNEGNFSLIAWSEVAAAFGLETNGAYDVRSGSVSDAVAVTPSVETVPVNSGTDAADDAAVWIHPTDPALSTIIGTDKTNGLVVYNLDGSILQEILIGDVNNVDVRYNFPLNGEPRAIVGATNRTNNSLVLYTVDPETRELIDVAADTFVSPVSEVYGFCMYYSLITGDYYALINSADSGDVEQYRLSDNGEGAVNAEVVREFSLGAQTEGCVFDDENATLFIGEEERGIWKFDAEPDGSDEGTLIAETDGDPLTADVEGLTLYTASDGNGYLIASSQGSSEFVLYERTGEHALVGTFRIVETATIDGVSGTDGIDVSNAALGDLFPNGVFVVQDDLNINPEANQNFKLVDWGQIAMAFDLVIDTDFDPRRIGAE